MSENIMVRWVRTAALVVGTFALVFGTFGLAATPAQAKQAAAAQKAYSNKAYAKKRYAKKRYAKKRYAKKRYAKKRYAKKRYAKKRYTKKRYAKRPRIAATAVSKKRYAKKSIKKKVRVASLGKGNVGVNGPRKSLSGGGVRWVASSKCLTPQLRGVIHRVAANYGSVTVSSTCRSRKHNARVGGASQSKHLTGHAVDFRVHGQWRAAWSYIRSAGGVGGYKHYGGGLFHIDTGPRRTW